MPAVIAHDESGTDVLAGPRRREATLIHGVASKSDDSSVSLIRLFGAGCRGILKGMGYGRLSLPQRWLSRARLHTRRATGRYDDYVPVTGLACKAVHLVDPKTGEVLAEPDPPRQ
jgi:hypothetical protein